MISSACEQAQPARDLKPRSAQWIPPSLDTASGLIGAQYVGDLWEPPTSESRDVRPDEQLRMGAPTRICRWKSIYRNAVGGWSPRRTTVRNYGTSKDRQQSACRWSAEVRHPPDVSGEMDEDSIIPFHPVSASALALALLTTASWY